MKYSLLTEMLLTICRISEKWSIFARWKHFFQ